MMTIEEYKKRSIRNNILMSLFLLAMIIGVGGAVYYYTELAEVNTKLKEAETDLTQSNLSLQKKEKDLQAANEELKLSREMLAKQKNDLVNQVQSAAATNDWQLLKPVANTIKITKDSAAKYELLGYTKLKAKDLAGAQQAFEKSEKSYNGYHHAYEIAYLLRKNKDKLNDPATQQQLLKKIQKDYNWRGLLQPRDTE